ncbi:MAG: beta-propeller fold lactonase family protein [Longimicrobiales bacterium]
MSWISSSRALGAAAAVLAVVSAMAAAAPVLERQAQGVPVAADGLLYVCNQDDATVSVIDVATQRVVRTIDLQALGFSANAKPHHIAVEPDGSHWYVSLIGDGKVVKLDREDRVVATAPFETPGMLTLHPTEDLLFVGRSMTAVNAPPRIGMIQRSDMSVDEIDVFFPRPHAMVVNPRTGIVYTASLGVNQVAAVDAAADRVEVTDVDGPPHALMQFALSPDGETLAVSGELSHTVLFFDISEDPMRPRQVASVDVEAQPFDPVFTTDGTTVWLGNKAANRITAIDVATHTVTTVHDDPRIRQPHGIATSADGRWVFISNTNVREDHAMHGGEHAAHAAPAPQSGGAGSITIIEAATGELVNVVEVGRNATGIAFSDS